MRDPVRAAERDPRLSPVLTAAAAPAERPLPGEAAALTAFRAAMRDRDTSTDLLGSGGSRDRARSSMKSRTATLATATLGILAFSGGGVALAATGVLPEAASDKASAVASAVLASVGLGGPSSQADEAAVTATTRAAERKAAREAEDAAKVEATEATEDTESTEDTAPEENTANDQGELVSATARAEYPSGRERGEAVSTVARMKGEAQRDDAEQRRAEAKAKAQAKRDAAGAAEVERSAKGRATATERSGGASDVGADNAARAGGTRP